MMNSTPFPPLVDLRATGWSASRVQIAETITSVTNEIVERAAREELEMSDHIYSFGRWCDLLDSSAK